MAMETQRTCEQCREPFVPNRHQRGTPQRFCSPRCQTKARTVRQGYRPAVTVDVPVGTVGAMSELLVSADLLKKGKSVFRALSPHCSCDLVVLENGNLTRVEVTTGYELTSGRLQHSKKLGGPKFDLLAVVIYRDKGYRIRYFPNHPT